MLAAWDQLQDADLEDVADVIFAQVPASNFTLSILNHFHPEFATIFTIIRIIRIFIVKSRLQGAFYSQKVVKKRVLTLNSH